MTIASGMPTHAVTANGKNDAPSREQFAIFSPGRPREKERGAGRIRNLQPFENKMTKEQHAIQTAVNLSTRLPLHDRLRFLQGLLVLAGDAPETHGLRDAVMLLERGDRWLESIAAGPSRAARRGTRPEERP